MPASRQRSRSPPTRRGAATKRTASCLRHSKPPQGASCGATPPSPGESCARRRSTDERVRVASDRPALEPASRSCVAIAAVPSAAAEPQKRSQRETWFPCIPRLSAPARICPCHHGHRGLSVGVPVRHVLLRDASKGRSAPAAAWFGTASEPGLKVGRQPGQLACFALGGSDSLGRRFLVVQAQE